MTRQSGYLLLAALLLTGGGMTAGVSLLMPSAEQETGEPTPDIRAKAVAAAEAPPILKTEIPPAAAAEFPPIAEEPPQSETTAAVPPVRIASAYAPIELPPAPVSAPPITIAAPPAPEPPSALAILESSIPVPSYPLAPTEPAASTIHLAALAPPASLPVEPNRPEPVSLGNLAPAPEVPLPLARPSENTSEAAARAADLFSRVKLASAGSARVVGFYSAGCIAGAQQLPPQGRTWQVMRPSRNRSWGHPELIAFIERLSQKVAANTGWPGILIGDMAQPRGGPLPAGHASHQVGLDVDIWLKPMPKEPFTPEEADTVPMVSVVAADNKQLDKGVWQPEDASLIKIAAQQPEVERVFVNPVIKKELCRTKTAADGPWMTKVRPWYGHDEHMHVRLKCPPGSPQCREQPGIAEGDGCGKALEHWFKPGILAVTERIRTRAPVERETKMRALPAECVAVLHAPDATNRVATGAR